MTQLSQLEDKHVVVQTSYKQLLIEKTEDKKRQAVEQIEWEGKLLSKEREARDIQEQIDDYRNKMSKLVTDFELVVEQHAHAVSEIATLKQSV